MKLSAIKYCHYIHCRFGIISSKRSKLTDTEISVVCHACTNTNTCIKNVCIIFCSTNVTQWNSVGVLRMRSRRRAQSTYWCLVSLYIARSSNPLCVENKIKRNIEFFLCDCELMLRVYLFVGVGVYMSAILRSRPVNAQNTTVRQAVCYYGCFMKNNTIEVKRISDELLFFFSTNIHFVSRLRLFFF